MSFYVYAESSSDEDNYGHQHHSHSCYRGVHHRHHSHHRTGYQTRPSCHHEHHHSRARTPSPPPTVKPKRCKKHRARSLSPTPAPTARNRRYDTHDSHRDTTNYASFAARVANLKLDESDSDEPGVHSGHRHRHRRARGRGPATQADYKTYARSPAHSKWPPRPRPAAWAYNPRARSPPPHVRFEEDSDDEPLPSRRNIFDEIVGSDEDWAE